MNQLQVVNSAEFGILAGSGNILAGGDNLGVLNKVTIGSNLSLTGGVLSAIGGGSGSVTSVGLTAPLAFNVSGSPITTSGTLALTAAGVASQYIRGDGTLADFPTSGGGGSSVVYYLNGSVNQGTIGGVVYKQLSKTPVIGTGTNFTINADGYIANFITDVGDPSLLSIPGGNWSTAFYFSSSSNGGTPSYYTEVYKYNGTTFTLLGSNSATPEVITNGTSVDIYYTNVSIPLSSLTVSDRIAIRVYVTHSSKTITLYTEGAHLSEIGTTFSYGLTALNGLSAQVQYFATGTSGSDFNISSSSATHTFNIPTASVTKRGLLSNTDWINFTNKQDSIGTGTTSQYLRGDLTWVAPVFTTSLSALTDVSLTALSNGQYLRYQAGNWINATPTWVTYNLYTADGTLTSNRTISSGGFTLGIAPKTTFNPSVTAASALAQGSIFSPTLLAAANNDVLVGVDISPTFTNGSFTGVSNIALRVSGSVNATSFIKTSGTSSQFLKADGSSDSNAYITRTGISATSPILYNSTTGVISIPVADLTHSGYLLNADWISFNSKQNALGTGTAGQFLAYDQTWQTVPYPTALSQLSDVTFTSLSNGQLLRYNAGGWSNYTPSYVTANLYTADGTLGSNRTISAGGYTLTINPKTTFSPSITAASLLAQGSIFTPTLTAAANNDVLVGVDINPTFTNGSFTGVSNFALRVTGAIKGSSSVTATSFVKTGAASTDFLKGDGTIDSNAYYLNTNPSSFISRTGISATSPVVYTSSTGVISMPVATLTTSGYLNNADWGSFNAKQNSLGTGTTSQYLRGDLTWQTPVFTTSLSALTDVTLTSLTNGQLLRYTVGGWVNFTPTYVAAGFFSATSPIFYNSSTGVISSQAASATLEGYVTTGTQTIAGAKTFSAAATFSTNVGIGVAPNSTLSGYTFVNIGDIGNQFGGGVANPFIASNGYYSSGWKYGTTGYYAALYEQNNGVHNFKYAASGTANGAITFNTAFSIANTGAATFSSSVTAGGNVAIGRSSASEILSINNPATSVGGLYPMIISEAGAVLGGIYSTYESSSPVGFGLAFKTYKQNVGLTEVVRIANSGNVGIGTTSPIASTGYATLTIGGATSTLGQITWNSGTTPIGYAYNDSTNMNIGSNAALIFQTTSSATERMRITSDGIVGINNSSPLNTAWGSASVSKQLTITSTGYSVINLTNTVGTVSYFSIGAGNGSFYMAYNNTIGAHALIISATNAATFGSTVTATSFYESSDKRQKTLIEDNFLAKGIETITPKLYTKNDKVELGYYAQDVQGILDGAVSEDKDGMLSLSYREVHTAKIYALELEVKELKELIKSIIDGNRS